MPKQELPSSVQAKMLRLADQEQQARTLASSTSMRISELEKAINLNPSGERVQALRREITFQQNTLSINQGRQRDLAALNNNLRRYLELLPADVEISEAKPVKLKLQDGESHLDAVARVRGEVVALISERSRIERADVPKDEKKEKLKEWIEQQQTRAGLYVRWDGGKPAVRFSTFVEGAHAPIPDIGSLLAWLDPRAMQSKLFAMIDASPEPGFTISTEDKEQRLKEIGRELLVLERREEAIISAAEDVNQTITRRVSHDSRAVLGIVVRGTLKAAKAA